MVAKIGKIGPLRTQRHESSGGKPWSDTVGHQSRALSSRIILYYSLCLTTPARDLDARCAFQCWKNTCLILAFILPFLI